MEGKFGTGFWRVEWEIGNRNLEVRRENCESELRVRKGNSESEWKEKFEIGITGFEGEIQIGTLGVRRGNSELEFWGR